jgi:hypothetical protein
MSEADTDVQEWTEPRLEFERSPTPGPGVKKKKLALTSQFLLCAKQSVLDGQRREVPFPGIEPALSEGPGDRVEWSLP